MYKFKNQQLNKLKVRSKIYSHIMSTISPATSAKFKATKKGNN